MFKLRSQKKSIFKRIASVATAVACSASMCVTFLGSPLAKQSVQNAIVAEAANVLDGAKMITSGGVLQKNRWYKSPNGKYGLIFQGSDGNLVLYYFNADGSISPRWATYTCNVDANLCQVQGDGNFVIYDKYNRPLWCTNTYRTPASLYISNYGDLFIYSRSMRGTKVWTSFNSRGTRIYQPPKTPVVTQPPAHSHSYNFYQEGNKVVWKCPGCGRIDHEVGFLEYADKRVSEGTYKTYEQALRRYLELIGTESSKIEETVKAYKAMNDLNETQKSNVRALLDKTDEINTDYLPNCAGKDFVEKCQLCNKVLSVYDFINSANKKTVDINTLNSLLGALQTAVSFVPLGDQTYGNVLKNLQSSMKETIQKGTNYKTRIYLSGLQDGYTETFDPSFWESEVTARDLKNQKIYIYNLDGLTKGTIEDFMLWKWGDKEGKIAYQAFRNLKCIQEATGQDFWDLVNMI